MVSVKEVNRPVKSVARGPIVLESHVEHSCTMPDNHCLSVLARAAEMSCPHTLAPEFRYLILSPISSAASKPVNRD